MTPRETTSTRTTSTAAYSSHIAAQSSSSTHTCCMDRSMSLSLVKVDHPSLSESSGSRCSSPMPTTTTTMSSGSAKRMAILPASSSGGHSKNHKKRRRIGVVCRTHSPVPSPHNSPKTFKAVKRIPPTLSGVQQAAQVLAEHGVVVFPTERTYEACVRWSDRWDCHYSQFFAVSFRRNVPCNTRALDYHLYVPKHKLNELDTLLGFPKKAFALKPPSLAPTSPSPTTCCDSPVTTTATSKTPFKIYYFSETRWILHRLAHRYWPGPVKIFVPMRTQNAVSSPSLPCELFQPLPLSLGPGNSHNSITPSTNATESCCENKDCNLPTASEQVASSPSFHAVSNPTTTNSINSTMDGVSYLGLRCPSHPLTARILEEALTCNNALPPSVVKMKERPPTAHRHRKHAWWLGLPVQGSEEGSYLTTAQEVAQQVPLRTAQFNSSSSPSSTANSSQAVTVHVVNGEDKRELFTVPTCQHYDSSSISLWIDDTTRTVHVFGKDSTSSLPVSVQQMERLLQEDVEDQDSFGLWIPPPSQHGKDCSPVKPRKSPGSDKKNLEMDGRNRVIRAVLRKWKVTHHESAGHHASS